ncbi:MAG: tyrosine-type recombinase/integrase [Vulcanimicrobiaceae bacterium]
MLTASNVAGAKSKAKPYKVADERGLFLLVQPSGGKWWRLKYRRPDTGKENLLSLGVYPDVSLKQARERREQARKLLAEGIDPGAQRQADKATQQAAAANTFEAIAREFIERRLASKAESHRTKVQRRLELYVFPYLGKRAVSAIAAPEILGVLHRIESRGTLETAHRALQNIGQAIRYAIATGRATFDPTPSLRGALQPVSKRNMAAPTDPAAVGAILRALEAFRGGPVVQAAVNFLPLVFCRPGELRTMRWQDVDLDAAQWSYTVSKTGTPHVVPLSTQAAAILRDLQPLTGHLAGGYVFPGSRSNLRPLSDAAINAALRRLGIDTKTELTGHGWRAVARTLLHEHLGYDPHVIEHQLAHAVPDALGTSYNRTKFLKERKAMMQRWADYLDTLRKGADVVPFKRRK